LSCRFHAEADADIFRLILQGFEPVTKKGYKAHFPLVRNTCAHGG
jgi:hypothetical protein